MNDSKNQVIIVGSGLAGLMAAYQLAQKQIFSLVLSKGPLIQTNTWMAQGGVAAAISKSDSIENHMNDTLTAGDGLCEPDSVHQILELGPFLMEELINAGMKFDIQDQKLRLGKEGGHNQRRILHVDDQTGRALHQFLLNKLQSSPLSKFCDFLPNTMVGEVTKNGGLFNLQLIDIQSISLPKKLVCSHIVLATGGAGKSFLYTSNWEGATGDGFKIAHDLGASLTNLEMIQFHPTCLYHSRARNFLISEALRGEGAKLINNKNERFVFNFHKDGELAPRDVVSRAIEHQIKSSGKDCVFLDISHKADEFIQKRFPTIYSRCLELGINITKEPIPVIPAAHYTCGGITTQKDLVSTAVPNLYAIGECGYTGLHGANRLASNSLLECLATAYICAKAISLNSQNSIYSNLQTLSASKQEHYIAEQDDLFLINALWDEVRTIMWNYVGIQRSNIRLHYALEKISTIESQISKWLKNTTHRDFRELQNIVFFSKACIMSALAREESRGCHYNTDFLKQDSQAYTTNFYQENIQLLPIN